MDNNINVDNRSFENKEKLFGKVASNPTFKRKTYEFSFGKSVINHIKRNKLTLISLILLTIIILACVFATFVTSYDPNQIDPMAKLQLPSNSNIFGTDEFGRDYFARSLYGGRVSLLVGFATMLVSILFGTTIGVIAGYYGGKLDMILMRLTDIFLALPSMLIMIILNTFLKPKISTLVIVLSLFSWSSVARIVRSETMSLKERDFMIASKFLGANSIHMIVKHIIPNCIGSISVAASLNIASAILTESSLSYLGLGVQIPQASWGSMLNAAQKYILDYPHLAILPGVLILITVLSFNLLGDAVRSALERTE